STLSFRHGFDGCLDRRLYGHRKPLEKLCVALLHDAAISGGVLIDNATGSTKSNKCQALTTMDGGEWCLRQLSTDTFRCRGVARIASTKLGLRSIRRQRTSQSPSVPM